MQSKIKFINIDCEQQQQQQQQTKAEEVETRVAYSLQRKTT